MHVADSQTAHEQMSPSQFGHAHVSQPHDREASDCGLKLAAVATEQHAWPAANFNVVAFDAVEQPHPVQRQTSQLQLSPLQFGHLQSTQLQDDLLFGDCVLAPAKTMAQVRAINMAILMVVIENNFMAKLQN